MKITKELKNITFDYDEDSQTFTLFEPDGTHLTLNKVYAFAFMRFVVRMAQRNWLRAKPIAKEAVSVNEEEPNNDFAPANPDQTEFKYDLSNKMFNDILKAEAQRSGKKV